MSDPGSSTRNEETPDRAVPDDDHSATGVADADDETTASSEVAAVLHWLSAN